MPTGIIVAFVVMFAIFAFMGQDVIKEFFKTKGFKLNYVCVFMFLVALGTLGLELTSEHQGKYGLTLAFLGGACIYLFFAMFDNRKIKL